MARPDGPHIEYLSNLSRSPWLDADDLPTRPLGPCVSAALLRHRVRRPRARARERRAHLLSRSSGVSMCRRGARRGAHSRADKGMAGAVRFLLTHPRGRRDAIHVVGGDRRWERVARRARHVPRGLRHLDTPRSSLRRVDNLRCLRLSARLRARTVRGARGRVTAGVASQRTVPINGIARHRE